MQRRIPSAKEVEAYMMSWPGKREYDIPADIYDRIHAAANGITQQIWGRPPEIGPDGSHVQALFDAGAHTPDQIHQAYAAMPHPHAPSVTVGEYEQFSKAKQLFDQHQSSARGK